MSMTKVQTLTTRGSSKTNGLKVDDARIQLPSVDLIKPSDEISSTDPCASISSDTKESVEKPDAPIETNGQEMRTVVIPMTAAPARDDYQAAHIELQLLTKPKERSVLTRIYRALLASNAKLEDGMDVNSRAKAILWILQQLDKAGAA